MDEETLSIQHGMKCYTCNFHPVQKTSGLLPPEGYEQKPSVELSQLCFDEEVRGEEVLLRLMNLSEHLSKLFVFCFVHLTICGV